MGSQVQIRKEIAARLKQAREQAGFHLAENFCEQAKLPTEEYRNHENGNAILRASKAMRYCDLLNITLQWLMLGVEIPTIHEKIKKYQELGKTKENNKKVRIKS